jgi:serine/threonine protein kinase
MADSLFDKRYRYDYIYPRGRSGETLRAVDTHDNDRPVVIKRPAALDAPPIRNGQEVSIHNERRALQRLAGHPVLTPLVGEGQFFVGGQAHQYIVMERAEGVMLSEEVRERASVGERLPLLETLVIVDSLLDLLHTAHSKGIVYNDVDTKHLFWNRDAYQLKVIDWGNAVFLDGDDMTPQGISRQADILQVGQLLYAILTGGRRADIPREAVEGFLVDFGEDERRVPPRLREIISTALHPNPRLRYPSINALRTDLAALRAPLERERNTTIATVQERLKRHDLSKNELRTLKTMLEPALAQDPAYPLARNVQETILDRLRDLDVAADLDTARLYMEAGAWSRALSVLEQSRDKGGSQTSQLIHFLHDAALLITEAGSAPNATVQEALSLVYQGKPAEAAHLLVRHTPNNEAEATLQWYLAERISSHYPDILLLRPNLFRLNNALATLADEGYNAQEIRAVFASIDKTLELMGAGNVELPDLRDGYSSVVEQLALVAPLLQTFAYQSDLSNRQLPLNALDRALNAAMALADSMHVIGKQATSSTPATLQALETARAVDPTNAVWDDVDYLLKRLYERLQACQTYVPTADGSDVSAWLKATQAELSPFVARLFDELLAQMVKGLSVADSAWDAYRDAVIASHKEAAVNALTQASEAVATLSPTLSGWFKNLRNIVENASIIERYAIPNAIGRALADGWEAFDKGRTADAEKLGQQAYESARNATEQTASERLRLIAQFAREWVERNGIYSPKRTQELLDAVEGLLSHDERVILDNFTAQMPSIETYLKAMGRGLVEPFARRSLSGLRLLFMRYVFLGALDAQEGRLSDAEFWREASARVLGEGAVRHPLAVVLDDYIARQRALAEAQTLLARLNGKQALSELEATRRQLENNPQERLLNGAIQALRELETALRDWQDGDFRSAGLKLEQAVKHLNDMERASDIKAAGFRAWLMDLMSAVAELHVQSREMRQLIEQRADEPDPRIYETHHDLVRVTVKLLGEDYAGTLRQWRDTYDAFLGAYTSEERRSKRLERMNELFKAMFIDRHPSYGLYRHWYDVLERSPEFPAPPTADFVPRLTSEAPLSVEDYRGRYQAEAPTAPPIRTPRLLVAGFVVVAVVLGIVGLAFVASQNNAPEVRVTISPTPQAQANAVTPSQEVALAEESTDTPAPPSATAQARFDTPTPRTPTLTPTQATPTPSDTPTQAPTLTPTITLTPSITPTLTETATLPPPTPTPLPPEGLQGTQDLLDLFRRSPDLPFNQDVFTPIENGYRLGIGTASSGETLRIAPPLALFTAAYGNTPASRLRSSSVELTLRTFNPAVVGADDVYFGLLLESTADGNNVGIQVQVVGNNVINLYRISNNERTFISQRAVNAVIARLRLERDLNNGNVTLLYNDEALALPVPFVAPDAPVLPIIYVRDGGVVVGVSNWRVTLR